MSDLPKVLIVDLSKYYGGSNSRILSLMTRSKPGTIGLVGLDNGVITQQAMQTGLQSMPCPGIRRIRACYFGLSR